MPLAAVQGAGLSQRGFLAGARTQESSCDLRCYENCTIRKASSPGVPIVVAADDGCQNQCLTSSWRSGGSGSWLGRNSDPDSNPDYRQRYDDHQHVNRQPCGYAFSRLGHSMCPLRPTLCAGWPRVAMNEFTCLGRLSFLAARSERRRSRGR